MDFYRLSLILTQLNMKFAIVLALIAFASASPATYDFTEEKTVKCNVCKYVMSEVEEYITADSTEETVLAKLKEVSKSNLSNEIIDYLFTIHLCIVHI
uniref:Saposin-like type B region 1 domain-containing protein n=1 Tax=Lepeophtheirus salmonis TaxID=72036 RepID=A0A0K2SYU7_LEPSM